MTYGEKIAELRKKSGMTQDDLGKAMNVSYQAVSKWERSESLPDFATMSKIAKLFKVPISYFEEDGETEQKNTEPDEIPATYLANDESDAEKPQPQEETEQKQEPIGVCTVCGKMLKAGEEETSTPKLVCKACSQRQKQEAQENAEREQQQAQERADAARRHARLRRERQAHEVIGHGFDKTLIVSLSLTLVCYVALAILTFVNLDSEEDLFVYSFLLFMVPLSVFGLTHAIAGSILEMIDRDDESGYKLSLSLIIGAIFAAIHIALFLVLVLSVEDGEQFYFLALMIGGGILAFTFVSQFLWGSVIAEVFTAGGFTFKLPRFIIFLTLDSLLFMIVAKFFLGILAAIVFVVTAVFFALVAIFASVFFFIPCLLFKIGRNRRARKSLNA